MADKLDPPPDAGPNPPKSRRRILLIAVPVLILTIGAAAWFSGFPRSLFGGGMAARQRTPSSNVPPTYVDVPELITNLNVPGKRQSYLKLHAKLELPSARDEAGVMASMPRILDLFQTYLRDMRPDELRGSEGSYRLREELIGRAAIAVAPSRVSDVLFVEMVIE